MNERKYLAVLESANADQLSELLRRPSVEEERVLALYFGEERLARLRRMALGAQRRGPRRGNVVVLHGIMGGELTFYPKGQSDLQVWLNVPRIVFGAVRWLRVTPQLTSENDVRPTGLLKKWYSEMLLGLASDQWNVQPFFYDWRLDLAETADALRAKIDVWFGAGAAVNLVAHSMGGLVARTFILRHSDRWNKGERPSRLIMLGTPNHGSFAIPQVITGALDTVRKLAAVDLKHNRAELLGILNTMPGSMQMLPSPYVMPAMERMYDASTWAGYGVARKLLDLARASHTRLQKIVDGARMSYIAGCNKVTKVDVADWSRLDDPSGYTDSLAGDGTVPHQLGFLFQDGKRIPTYFVETEHGALPNDENVVVATQQLLATGACSLPVQPPKARALVNAAAVSEGKHLRELDEEAELLELSRQLQAQSRGARGEAPPAVSAAEVRAEELLVRSFLAETRAVRAGPEPAPPIAPAGPVPKPADVPSIKIRLIHGGIEKCGDLAPDADAISVGHYVGVAPQNAELALDWAITTRNGKQKASESDLIITALQRRGVIVGELCQNFLLPDPGQPKRVIVIAGMGQPGTFREPELAVLARELVWMLGRSGRKHLYTVLIGSGAGNLGITNSVGAWMRGIRRALYEARAAHGTRLEAITFVEYYAANYILIDRALKEAASTFDTSPEPMRIEYAGPGETELKEAKAKAEAIAKNMAVSHLRQQLDATAPSRDREPIRLTIRLVRDTFEFAALTADAAMPQRETRVDPQLVDEANNQLPPATDYRTQDDKGNLLGRLLLPGDLREVVVKPPTPLVLALDRTTARIHWEMLALAPGASLTDFNDSNFLGTACGLTRQLRTTFAPLPEPPLLSGRALRILVVADPAEDAPLPGAQEEGEAVVRIFERFKTESGLDVEIVPLLGPRRASRVAVLEQLINHHFDILHYAGHCFYDEADPSHCGWIFTGNRLLTADELNRVDRIPRFVFSNACESGITPEQREKRTALLAPSFAEAFFARGVGNFICTAWPVDDAAALAFAQRLYEGILGLRGQPEPMHEAMAAARSQIARLGPGGLQTWGAYQHYGDPNFRIGLTPSTTSANAQRSTPKPSTEAKSKKRETTRRANRK